MNSPPPVKSLEGHPISSGSPTSPEILVQHIGKYGKDVFWVAFVISVLATLLMGVLAVRRAKGHRLFHFLFILVAVVASLSYFAMASGSGYLFVNLGESTKDGKVVEISRQIFWMRQADRAVTMPLLLLALLSIAGVSWADIIVAMISNVLAVVTGTFAAFFPGSEAAKWGWYVFSCGFLAYVCYALVFTGIKTCKNIHPSLFKLYAPLGVSAAVIIVLYAVTFAFAELTGVISVDCEVLIYSVFDIAARSGMGLLVLVLLQSVDPSVLPDSFFEERDARAGPIQLPESD